MATLTFWFDFASTYSWLSAERIAGEAEARGVEIAWRPFLLGPIFKAQGWDNSPFVLYPAKGRYMVHDVARIAKARDLPFVGEEALLGGGFPQISLHAARLAVAASGEAFEGDLVRTLFRAQFAKGRDIGDKAVLTGAVREADAPLDLLERAASSDVKARLRSQTEDAMSRGLFGAPTFTVDDELFWGDDRLDMALDRAASGR